MGTTGASTSILINGTGGVTVDQSSVTLTNGNLTLSGSSSLGSFAGHVSIGKEFRLPGVATAFSGVFGLTSSTTVTTGDRKYVILRNDGTSSGLTASLSAGNSGQVVEIYHIKGASGYPVYVNASNFYGLTGSIALTETGDTIKCVYDSPYWYLWNYAASSFATAGGSTASSISFTTI
jgi:hypothetical protein